MVTETDVSLTKASNAVLIAFNVKPSKEAKILAEQEKITIHSLRKTGSQLYERQLGLTPTEIRVFIDHSNTSNVLENVYLKQSDFILPKHSLTAVIHWIIFFDLEGDLFRQINRYY